MNEELNLLEETTNAVVETVETSAIGKKGVKGALVAGLAVVTLGLGFLAYKIIKAYKTKKASTSVSLDQADATEVSNSEENSEE